MATRTASAQWNGDLRQGDGEMRFGSGAFEGRFSWGSRMEEGPGTNPEELIGAAHAGCFSMQLSGVLTSQGHPESVQTDAKVQFERAGEGWAISRIDLVSRARVPGIDDETFQRAAATAKATCPVSQALSTEITLDATLES
jgi:osmotically inducible protein OsmC